ncbi:uncharacterized protein N7479_004539 [Penicillium vulpinum]|uniref:Uncharacterized protein n=1 Tax=Penicillium vulpinum TaxID=29845 RepID=A0A1V6RRW6_9EURO|nr:uncharacterized protein N7479_004539 [Penicillium vulpinum]KAJ5964663.1 hypothetical protein N7479_004539 [Penicillium vulpinum]OQE04308.1 hypothetical protein PENVUL_c034G00051 [Penicillium vulpinum]
MDATAMQVARESFAYSRNDFVAYIQELAAGDMSGQDVAAIQTELHRIANTLSGWTESVNDPKLTCSCFSDHCCKLSFVIAEVAEMFTVQDGQLPLTVLKMLNMLAMQVGRVTLDGHREEDEFARGFDHMAKDEDRRWQIKSQGPDDGRSALLFGLWTRMNRTSEHGPNCPHAGNA